MKINNPLTPPVFKIRASALGQLMTQPKTKADKDEGNLSQTAKSMLTLWYKEQLYSRRKPIESKYMTKGIECEDASIEMLNPEWVNNKEQFSNDYMTGEPDVITDDTIIDIKNSWDFTTFPLFAKQAKGEYEWQVLGYMWLCGKKKGEVVYTLMDTPEHLINREYLKLNWNINKDVPESFAKDYLYQQLPEHLRIKRFNVEYDEDKIEQIKEKVGKAREFISAIAL